MRAGLNMSDIAGLDSEKRNDYYVGAYLSVKFNKQFTLQPELNYSRQGAKLNGVQVDEIREITIEYLSLSILAKVYLVGNLHLTFGQYIDVNLYDNIYHSNDFFLFPHLDLGFIVGAGFDIISNLTVEARYRHGLIDVYNRNPDEVIISNIDGKNINQVIQLGLAYKFDF
jgi:opacity protein-like surface antigen